MNHARLAVRAFADFFGDRIGVIRLNPVLLPDFKRIHVQRFRQLVNLPFLRERSLRRAVAAKRPAHRQIRINDITRKADIRNRINRQHFIPDVALHRDCMVAIRPRSG